MYALASLGSPSLLRGRRGAMCIAKGSDVRPGVPWVSASFAWQAWDKCTAKGSDVRPGVPWVSASFVWQAWDNVHCQGVGCTPWRPLGLRLFCVAGVGQCALPRGRMYGVGCTPWRPLSSASFAWQTWDNAFLCGTHSLTHALTHSLTDSLTHSLTLSLTDSLTHSPVQAHTYTHAHTHKLTHHHHSITLILPFPFLLFYAQSKSKEVGNMWGYPVL